MCISMASPNSNSIIYTCDQDIPLRQSKVNLSSPALHIMLFAYNKSVVCSDLQNYCQENLKFLDSKLVKLPFIFY